MIEIKITNEAYLKLKYFVQECDTEISGLGKVRENVELVDVEINEDDLKITEFTQEEKRYLEIYDIEVLSQHVSAVHSDLDEEALAKFLTNKLKNNRPVEDYKVWWHSHVNMDASFSLGDEETIRNSTEFPYLISIVSNKQGDMETRIDLYKPFRHTLSNDDINITIGNREDNKIKKTCQNQIKQKVRS